MPPPVGVVKTTGMLRWREFESKKRIALELASDASSFITGVALLVDGGVSISRT